MQENEVEPRTKMLKRLSGLLNKTCGEDFFFDFLEATSELSAERFEKAFRKSMRECRFFPSPAEFLEYAGPPSPQEQQEAFTKRWGGKAS